MKKYINQLPNEYEDKLNIGLMTKEYDKPLVEYIFDALKGFEILPNVKILGYEWDGDESNFDINDHTTRRNTNKNKNVKSISHTRCGVMHVDVEVSGNNPKTGKKEIHYIKKDIIIPIQDKHGYYLIKGKKCYLIYQMVDKMLYPSLRSVTIKSLMPIQVINKPETFTDVHGESFTIPIYTIQIFKNAINVLLIYSHLATDKMLEFLEVAPYIKVEEKRSEYPEDEWYRFECGKKSNCVVCVLKKAFQEEIYIQSIAACLIKLYEDTKMQYDMINNWDNWMMIVGGKNTIKRGIYQHIFFNRLLDDITKKELKINDYDKQDIYHLLKWFLQNYHVLWSKDNLALENKRFRCNEYIASFITEKISKGINRIVSLGDKASIRDITSLFRFPSDLFIARLYSSGVLRYESNVSDMDMSSKSKVTKKGPNSLGNQDHRMIPTRQRELHPSFLGYLDLSDTSSI